MNKQSRLALIITCVLLLLAPVLPTHAQGNRITLQDAIRQGILSVQLNGTGELFFQQSLAYRIQNKRSTPVTVVVPLGLVFDPDDASYQSLIIAKEYLIELAANAVVEGKWYGFCINLSRHAPTEETTYHIGQMASGPLLQVIQAVDKKSAAGKLGAQFAVWRVTDGFTLESFNSPEAQNSELMQAIAPLLSLARPEMDLAQGILEDSNTGLKFYSGTPPPNLFEPGGLLNPGTQTGIPQVDTLKQQLDNVVKSMAIVGGLTVCVCLGAVLALVGLIVFFVFRRK